MKIKSLTIKNHAILGDIDLNFSNSKGEIYDTIVFMGENGVGKTTLLDFISTIFQGKYNNENVNNNCSFILSLLFTETEIENINKNIIEMLRLPDFIKHKEIIIEYHPENTEDLGRKYKITDIQMEYIYSALTVFDRICPTIYSPAQTNLKCRDITATTTKSIDVKPDKSVKANEQLGQEIKQMFIDLEANDSSELANWVMKNPGCVPPEDVKQIRMKRFNKAFYHIFANKLKYDRVENIKNKKEIYFKCNGNDVSLDYLSSGQKQIIYRGAFLLKDKKSICGNIAIIDEPEISMHPKWQMEILNYYKSLFIDENNKQTSQVFLSSHSEYVFKAKTDKDLVLILSKDINGKINIKQYDKQNILPFNSFAENKYFAFDIPTFEFFNELYGYIGWKTKKKFDNYIQTIQSQIDVSYQSYCQLINWQKDNNQTISVTPITHIRHEVHHPENQKNTKLYNKDEDLRKPIEFMLYLINTFKI